MSIYYVEISDGDVQRIGQYEILHWASTFMLNHCLLVHYDIAIGTHRTV